MDKIEQGILENLTDAAWPFSLDKADVETSGMVPSLDELRRCIYAAEQALKG